MNGVVNTAPKQTPKRIPPAQSAEHLAASYSTKGEREMGIKKVVWKRYGWNGEFEYLRIDGNYGWVKELEKATPMPEKQASKLCWRYNKEAQECKSGQVYGYITAPKEATNG